jgi:hypothetical protein
MTWFSRLRRRQEKLAMVLDEQRVTLTGPEGEHFLEWADLESVEIVTTDQGPLVDDVFWALRGGHGDPVVIPSETPGCDQLLARLQRLPGFDNSALIEAMGNTSNARFVLWGKTTSDSLGAPGDSA